MGAISGWVEVWTDYHCMWPLLLERGIIFSFSMIVGLGNSLWNHYFLICLSVQWTRMFSFMMCWALNRLGKQGIGTWDFTRTFMIECWMIFYPSSILCIFWFLGVRGWIRWNGVLKGNGIFDIQSFYKEIWGATSAPFPWKGIWSVKGPKRVLFFLWTVALGKILSLDNLTKWGLPLVNWCCMCQSNRESVDHLLIHCDITFALWGVLFQMLGIWWVLPGNVVSFLFSQRNWFGKYGLDIWNMVPASLMWLVWKE